MEDVLPIDVSAEKIGKSVIDAFFASEKFYGNNKTNMIENKKEILLLDGKRILVDLPWTDKWMNNVDICKISYYVQTAEDLLLECGLQVYKKFASFKQIEQFIKLFEDLIAGSRL